MSSAAAYYLLFQQRGRSKIWVLGLLGGILVSLLLLQCRTALIGAALAAFIICNYRFRWFFHFRKQSLFKKIITGVATMLLITPVCYYAYKAKQRSADGRLLIWKVSTGIIAQKPFNGVGLGMFEHDYNLEQSDYIKKGKAADAEKNNATHVYMAYNEWLETGVEGGIPAMMLLTALFVSLILLYPKEHSSPDREQKRATDSQEESYAKVTAWAGVIAFVSMSMVNFTIQALPAMCVFLLFMAILCSPVLPIKSSLPFVRGLFAKPLIKNATVAVLVMAALYFMYARISVANNLLQVKKASVAVTSGDNASALEILVPLTVQLNNAESYLQLYGKALMNTKKYNEAIIQFNRAKNLVSYPNLYLKIGECYTSLQQYENARSCFLLAHNMEPSRLAPEYAMMQLSVSMKDSTTALAKAKLIINASSKTANARSLFYRQQAFEIIHRLQ
nr:O-antigen ligase family protein [Niastella soli]